jgi:hypothetical protein
MSNSQLRITLSDIQQDQQKQDLTKEIHSYMYRN